MSKRDNEGLEPGCLEWSPILQECFLRSIAVSMKRIADNLERPVVTVSAEPVVVPARPRSNHPVRSSVRESQEPPVQPIPIHVRPVVPPDPDGADSQD